MSEVVKKMLDRVRSAGGWRGDKRGVAAAIVRQRLAALNMESARLGQFHPEPEVLASLADPSLSEAERTLVLRHLAQCGDCRETVFLASPHAEELLAGAGEKGARWRWPVLRWAALGVCAAVCLVVIRHETRIFPLPGRPELASSAVAARPADATSQIRLAEGPDRRPASPPAGVATFPLRFDSAAAEKQAVRLDGGRVVPERHASSAAPKFPMQFDGPQSALEKLPEAERTAQTALGVPHPATGLGAATSGDRGLSGGGEVHAADSGQEAGEPVGRARPPGLAPLPRWILSTSGELERSRDEGLTWETVAVAPQASFRALFVLGDDVWVGGSSGALYHSSDSGVAWAEVVADREAAWRGASITGLEFTSPGNGTLTTSAGDTWVTSNSGKNWQPKQK